MRSFLIPIIHSLISLSLSWGQVPHIKPSYIIAIPDISKAEYDKLYARFDETLDLQDSRSLQCFDVGELGPHDEKAPNWTPRFEILEVYEGDKYDDTVISELFFDGIDVH